MLKNGWASRAVTAILAAATMTGVLGSRCGVGGILPPGGGGVIIDTVRVELVNTTGALVDPGLLIDGIPHLIDPPLAPDDVLPLDVDCFADTRLQTQADLLAELGPIPSENDPFVDQGFEFVCGDVVSFVFAEDDLGFFTNVEINGIPIAAPTP